MIPRIDPPPSVELDALHAASLRILEHVGVVFPDRRAQRLLADAGAEVHADRGLVKIPPRLVDEALATAPRDILLAGRDPGRDVRCDGSDTFLALDGTGAYTLDHRSGEQRPSTLQDLADAAADRRRQDRRHHRRGRARARRAVARRREVGLRAP